VSENTVFKSYRVLVKFKSRTVSIFYAGSRNEEQARVYANEFLDKGAEWVCLERKVHTFSNWEGI
jgi:hypothetical protein